MAANSYGLTDFGYVAAGAAVLASGGGGSYQDAVDVLDELAGSGWTGSVPVQAYDGETACAVLAMMGSPDAATSLTLDNIQRSYINTLDVFSATVGAPACLIPVEIGPINSIVPLLAAAEYGWWVVDGDGAGRAVPELPQTTYAGSENLATAPCALANDADVAALVEDAIINAPTAARVETLAGGIVSAFGSFSGIALWSSNIGNGYALSGNYISGTLSQARALGQFLLDASSAPATADVAAVISEITGRAASAAVVNFYITAITQATTSASLDAGVIQLDNSPNQADSTATCYLYNLNESLILYSSTSSSPLIVAPDSICYYSESTGLGFSNATSDLATYYDFSTQQSTGLQVSIIKVAAAPALCAAPGVMESFAGLLRQIGYAGGLPET